MYLEQNNFFNFIADHTNATYLVETVPLKFIFLEPVAVGVVGFLQGYER